MNSEDRWTDLAGGRMDLAGGRTDWLVYGWTWLVNGWSGGWWTNCLVDRWTNWWIDGLTGG